MSKSYIEIDIGKQKLRYVNDNGVMQEYTISTGKNGAGEMLDSECTPRGEHVIAEKIGAGCDPDTIFVGRQPTGELYRPELREKYPRRDWILTRILWLAGTEADKNRGGEVDTYARYIYIHGAPDDVELGKPGSRGCIRMRNTDVIELFENVEVGTPVIINE